MAAETDVKTLVAQTRAVGWWIDRQIERGRSDEEIIAELPVAAAFICGRVSLDELQAVRS